jgi:dihydroxyacetone kinase DhaKLM complex PTS-EIIA-like component DhaM
VIGLVLVGHSAEVVRGVVAMVAQASPGVAVDGAGGLGGGRLGTNAIEVGEALRRVLAATDDGVLVQLDLGSASMALDLALGELDEASQSRVLVSNGPFVEGAVLAGVAAAGGASLEACARAADTALDHPKLDRG